MRIEPARYDKFKTSSWVRGVLFALFALLIFGFASFWLVIGVVAMFVSPEYPILNGILFILLGGLIPGAGGLLLASRAILHFRRLTRMRRFVAALVSGQVHGLEELKAAMGAPAPIVRAVAFEAVQWGILGSDDVLSLTSSAQDRRAPSSLAPGSPAQSGFPPSLPSYASHGSVADTVAAAVPSAPPQAAGQHAMALPLQSWVGRTLKDTWYVESLLGHGGMGAVFRARHLRTGRRYALKVMLAQGELTWESLHRFEREASAASALGHPGIVAVHDFDRTLDGAAFLVMDLFEGETLQQRLERHGMIPWSAAKRIGLEVGDALAAAHDAGLLHRDVKPGNVFLCNEPRGERVVLLDFGLVKRMGAGTASRVTASGAVVGTPLYMSPEQARGEPLDARSDLYGLAVVIFEMVVGVPPFFDRTQAAVYARLLREQPPRASAISPGVCPPGLDDVLARALATRREDRYESVRALLTALTAVGASQTSRNKTAVI